MVARWSSCLDTNDERIEQKAGGLKRKIRDRKRSVTKRVIAMAHALRRKGPAGEERRKREYGELLHVTRQILGDTGRMLRESECLPIARGPVARAFWLGPGSNQ